MPTALILAPSGFSDLPTALLCAFFFAQSSSVFMGFKDNYFHFLMGKRRLVLWL